MDILRNFVPYLYLKSGFKSRIFNRMKATKITLREKKIAKNAYLFT